MFYSVLFYKTINDSKVQFLKHNYIKVCFNVLIYAFKYDEQNSKLTQFTDFS